MSQDPSYVLKYDHCIVTSISWWINNRMLLITIETPFITRYINKVYLSSICFKSKYLAA